MSMGLRTTVSEILANLNCFPRQLCGFQAPRDEVQEEQPNVARGVLCETRFGIPLNLTFALWVRKYILLGIWSNPEKLHDMVKLLTCLRFKKHFGKLSEP